MLAKESMAKVISIYPKELVAERPWSPNRGAGYHKYVCPAAKLGEAVEIEVQGAFQKTYFGEDVGEKFEFIPDTEVARDIVNQWSNNVLGVQSGFGPGVFVLDESRSREEQLAEVQERQEAFFTYLFQSGEDLAKIGQSLSITKDMKDAAKYLGRETAEWTKEQKTQRLKKCPFCVSEIPIEATVCKVCQRDLTPKKEK